MRYTRNGTREQDAAGGRIPAWQANGPGRAGAGAPSGPLGLASGQDPAGPGRVDHHRAGPRAWGSGSGICSWSPPSSTVRWRSGGATGRGWRRCSSGPGAWRRSWPSRRWPAGSAPASCRSCCCRARRWPSPISGCCPAATCPAGRWPGRSSGRCPPACWPGGWRPAAWSSATPSPGCWASAVIGWRIGKSQQEVRALSRQQGRSGALAAPHRPGGAAMAARPAGRPGRGGRPPGPARRRVEGGADGRGIGAPGRRRAGPRPGQR